MPLGLTAVASATDAAIQKKIYGSGTTTLIFSNQKIEDMMKIVKSLKESGLSIKGISETIRNESKRRISWNFIRSISFHYIKKCINRKRSNESR